MFVFLQIIITVVVIYLVFSVIVYVVVEWLSALLKLRGQMLLSGIAKIFQDQNIPMGQQLYDHPLINNLKKGNTLPSYIPAANISGALIDIISSRVSQQPNNNNNTIKDTYQNFVQGANALPDGNLKKLLTSITKQTDNLETLTKDIEKYFNDAMDRVSGWYKKNIKIITFIVAAAVTIGFNVDTIYVIKAAKADPVLRQKMNDLGDRLVADTSFTNIVNGIHNPDNNYYDEYVNDSSVNTADSAVIANQVPAADSASVSFSTRQDQLVYMYALTKDAGFPIGWNIQKGYSLLWVLAGWLLTACALSAGAPFWFDMLKKLINIRSSGPKPDK